MVLGLRIQAWRSVSMQILALFLFSHLTWWSEVKVTHLFVLLVAQLCPTLCDPMNCSLLLWPWDSQAIILEWVAISLSRGSSWSRDRTQVSCIAGRLFTDWATREARVKVKSLNHVWLFATPWTVAYQALPSVGFSRQEYWSGVPLPSPMQFLSKFKWHFHRTWKQS